MVRRKLTFLSICGLAAAVVAAGLGGSTAEAGWHWHGSWGGYGSFGSSGYGSSGAFSSYGSHGGGWRLGSRLHHHGSWGSHGGRGWASSYASWGSSGGSYGSSGGSSGGGYKVYYGGSSGGSYGGSSGGSYGGSSGGSYGGSSGGSYGGSSGGKSMYAPAPVPADGQPMPAIQPPPPPAGTSTALPGGDLNQAMLKVSVPEDALVYVNGLLTKSTGTSRSYMSRGLNRGFQYTYEVRAEMMRDGQKVEETKVVQLQAGETRELAFQDNLSREPVTTTLTLNVPSDAKVTLGGNPTHGEGNVRVFSTTKLSDAWQDYVVQVSYEKEGRTVTQEKVISLQAGDSKTLTFDFDSTQVASR